MIVMGLISACAFRFVLWCHTVFLWDTKGDRPIRFSPKNGTSSDHLGPLFPFMVLRARFRVEKIGLWRCPQVCSGAREGKSAGESTFIIRVPHLIIYAIMIYMRKYHYTIIRTKRHRTPTSEGVSIAHTDTVESPFFTEMHSFIYIAKKGCVAKTASWSAYNESRKTVE